MSFSTNVGNGNDLDMPLSPATPVTGNGAAAQVSVPVSTMSATPAPQTTIETAFQILGGIQDQIKFADGKAGFIVAVMAVLFGFTASNLATMKSLAEGASNGGGLPWGLIFAMVIYTLVTVGVAGLAVYSVISRLGGNAPQCKVFFAHISWKYGRNYRQYAEDMRRTTNAEWIDELGGQILEVSHIATRKHKLVRWAGIASLFALASWLAVFILMLAPNPAKSVAPKGAEAATSVGHVSSKK